MCDSNSLYTHNKIKEFCIQDLCEEDSNNMFITGNKRSRTALKKSNTTRTRHNDSMVDNEQQNSKNSSKDDSEYQLH